jgi:hypothetical protein
MHWRFEPILPWLLIGTLALLAIPRAAHPGHPVAQGATGTPTQEPSPAIRRACDADARRLCPQEYGSHSAILIGNCMKQKAGPSSVSLKCQAAWIKEHGLSR